MIFLFFTLFVLFDNYISTSFNAKNIAIIDENIIFMDLNIGISWYKLKI